MRPGESHRVRILGTETYERYAMNFPLSVFDGFDPKRILMTPFTARPLGKGNMFRGYDSDKNVFAGMCADDLDDYSRKIKMITSLVIILDRINREYGASVPQYSGDLTAAGRIVGYVNDHLFDSITVEILAEHFYLSKSQFTRIFRQATGAPPWEYIIAKRLIAAKEMISGGESAARAAENCGFGDYSSFYRAYVKRFGCAPTG